jgi:hypothetical protein
VTPKSLTIDELERWVLFGADWRLVELSDERAIVDLCACSGELIERRQADDPALIGYLRSAQSDQPPKTGKEAQHDR